MLFAALGTSTSDLALLCIVALVAGLLTCIAEIHPWRAMGKRVAARVGWACVIGTALVPPIYLVYSLTQFAVDVPFYDQWQFVPQLEKSFQGTLTAADLWKPHNEHIIVFPKLIMIVLAHLTNWNLVYEQAVSVVLAAATCFVLCWQIRRTARDVKSSGRLFFPLISLVVFSLAQQENFMWGWQIQILLNVFAAVLGLFLISDISSSTWQFVGALLAGIVSSYSFANGLVYWPVGALVLMGIRCPGWKYRIVVWCITAFMTVLLYFWILYEVIETIHAASGEPIAVSRFALIFLGGPVSSLYGFPLHLGTWVPAARCAGVFVIVGTSILVVRLICKGDCSVRVVVPYIGLSLYAIGSALVTAVGRFDPEDFDALNSRYITISSLSWVSLIVLLWLSSTEVRQLSARDDLARRFNWSKFAINVCLVLITFSVLQNSLAGRQRMELRSKHMSHLREMIYRSDELQLGEKPGNREVLRKYQLSLFRERQ